MNINDLCLSYLSALNEGNLENILELFTEDAVVLSPLYGEMPVKDFYNELFSDTNNSQTEVLNIFLPANKCDLFLRLSEKNNCTYPSSYSCPGVSR